MNAAAAILMLTALGACTAANAGTVQERNKTVAVSFFEDVLDKGRFEHYAESHSKDFVAHTDAGRLATLEEDVAAAKEERKALPDMRMHVDHVVAERDLVSVTWTATGTNTQAGMGFPATGKRLSTTGMTLFRFSAGKIVEEWSVFDMLSVLTQLGLYAPQ
jgi:steroid delta-isomerase-like uncharacterized protein